MIVYSTEFPIDPKNSVESVLTLAREWIIGSPHSVIRNKDWPISPPGLELKINIEDKKVNCFFVTGGEFTIGGIQYSYTERNQIECEWTTTIVANQDREKLLLSVQVSCESTGGVPRLPSAKKPYFVRQALKKLGIGMDGSIPMTDEVFVFSNDEVQACADIINGSAGNRLPIIYVSTSYDGTYMLDPSELAKWVSGQAHVFVEPSRDFSIKLREATKSRNPYGGNVAVFWPESNFRKSYYIDDDRPTGKDIQVAIARDISQALANRRQSPTCTWLYLKEVVSRHQYERLKATGSTQIDDYIAIFDSEIKTNNQRLEESEKEISRLNAELRKYAGGQSMNSAGLLNSGKESNFYDGEIRDVIIDALHGAKSGVLPDSRKEHILSDLINNNVLKNEGLELSQKIKNILKGYVSMSPKTKGALTTLGFDITEDGKHYKAVYNGDGRYTFSISKTSSDHRFGMNMASDINKKLF